MRQPGKILLGHCSHIPLNFELYLALYWLISSKNCIKLGLAICPRLRGQLVQTRICNLHQARSGPCGVSPRMIRPKRPGIFKYCNPLLLVVSFAHGSSDMNALVCIAGPLERSECIRLHQVWPASDCCIHTMYKFWPGAPLLPLSIVEKEINF